MSRCSICGEKLSRWPFVWVGRHPHYKAVHSDFVEWHHRFLRNVWLIGLATLLLIVVIDFVWYRLLNGPYPTYSALIMFGYAVVVIADFDWNLHRFKRRWNGGHSSTVGDSQPDGDK